MNPMELLKMKSAFDKNHPKVSSFVAHVLLTGIPEGTILELTVTKPGQEAKTTSLRVTAEDLEMIRQLKEVRGE